MDKIEQRKAVIQEYIESTRASIVAREKQPYRRGDAESTLNDEMFISIFQHELDFINTHGRLMTAEEGQQNLREHGWTIQ